ncbi:hypothetical protein GAGA_1923 [Paraglaciecola agarilytica NO2]|uniref:Uncharacterized protein n=1 Tax=Paraglaciecola agarilytica NO2 TaxID=1125747 RepID=A0ABQ0I602_9ALTE|nr:hypothetical protein GAGA_1923 [Paraglaciecola agarilytica NO2]
MTSKENNYSFSHAPCLSPFKLSLSHHLLTWNGILSEYPIAHSFFAHIKKAA